MRGVTGRAEIAAAFGTRVRELRTERGWSQEKLAERANMHRTFVGHVERGENQVTLETLCRLADALDVTPSHLVERLPYRSTATDTRRS